MLKLYHFFRSSTSHRLRIALQLKGLTPEYISVNLPNAEHLTNEVFAKQSPQRLVPILETPDGRLFQSPAIIEWLEETHPNPALLPNNPFDRAQVRALAALIGCDIHPLQNRRVLNYLRDHFLQDEDSVEQWCQHWIHSGLKAYEAILQQSGATKFSVGDSVTLADVYLIPQVESARRFKLNLDEFPRIRAIDEHCGTLQPFKLAAPSAQKDYR